MRIATFNSVRHAGDWEWNFITPTLNFRIGYSQVAVWWKQRPLFMWLRCPLVTNEPVETKPGL